MYIHVCVDIDIHIFVYMYVILLLDYVVDISCFCLSSIFSSLFFYQCLPSFEELYFR